MLLERDDFETLLFAVFTAATAMVIAIWRGVEPPVIFLWGALMFCGLPACVYGTKVIGRSAPTLRGAYTEYRAAAALPARLALAPPDTSTAPDATMELKWRGQLRRFMLVAKLAQSYSVQQLAYDRVEHGTVTRKRFMTDKAWRALTTVLVEIGILVKSKKGTVLAPNMTYQLACRKLQSGPISVPDREPPEVWL
jgi:hypothetical protein